MNESIKPKLHALEEIVKATDQALGVPSLTDTRLITSSDSLILTSYWSQIDVKRNSKVDFTKTHFLTQSLTSEPKLLGTTAPEIIKDSVWSAISPNGELKALIVNWNNEGKAKQLLEIWSKGKRIDLVDLTEMKLHSQVYEKSSLFGSFEWSSDSSMIAYVAEIEDKANVKSFFTGDRDIDESNYEIKYANFYKNDWGELCSGKSVSIIAVYDVKSKSIRVLRPLPDDYTPAQFTWNGSKGILFNAYHTKPYRLGVTFCPMRKCELFYYDLLESSLTQLTTFDNQSVRDPRFSPDYEWVCWLQNPAYGPHFHCSKLMVMNWRSKEIQTFVDIVNEYPKNEQDFPGIFAYGLPSGSCWSSDSKRILVNTCWKHTNKVILVNRETRKITQLDTQFDVFDSCAVLNLQLEWITLSVQSFNKTPALFIAKLPSAGSEQDITWTRIEDPSSDDLDLQNKVDVELLKFKPKHEHPNYPDVEYDATLIRPTGASDNDTLVSFIHGGPHSSFNSLYSPFIATLYSLGYSLLLVNYRGSIGYGQDAINSTAGAVGINDVNDCQESVEFVVNKYKYKNTVVYGGSHGGYLACHLVGQYPEFYKAAAVRNPVTNLQTKIFVADNPDCNIYEAVGEEYKFDFRFVLEPNLYQVLHDKSPVKYIDQVKTPLLFLVGLADQRVPPSQSIQFHKALLARDVPSKLIKFQNDSHPIKSPTSQADCIINTVLWFERYI